MAAINSYKACIHFGIYPICHLCRNRTFVIKKLRSESEITILYYQIQLSILIF